MVSKKAYVAATTLGEVKVYGLSVPSITTVKVDNVVTAFTFDSALKVTYEIFFEFITSIITFVLLIIYSFSFFIDITNFQFGY